jgi:hypothetical protein
MAIISISDSQVNGADEILVADSSSKIPAKDGSQITILNATNVATGTIASARLDTGTTANKLVLLDGSGNLPAVDASLLTGIVSATISASDPTISTNPSGGVGTEWNNSTSGEMYICTDATAGENVWKNVGAGTGDVAPFHFIKCTSYYFSPGGYNPNFASIDKNVFATDGNSTDQGDLTAARRGISGSSSTTHGYVAGGYINGTWATNNVIDKFAMATTADSTDVGDLTTGWQTGGGITSETYGYIAGGYTNPSPTGSARMAHKYSFAADGGSTLVGNVMQTAADYVTCGSSSTHGYVMGGYGYNQIDKFDYASETPSYAVGTLAGGAGGIASQSTDGYVYTVGYFPSGYTTRIDKMSTASDSSSVASGSTLLTSIQNWAAGASSTTHGYTMGGYRNGSSSNRNTIDKFSFSTTGTSTDVGDLNAGRGDTGGSNQY